MESLQVNPKGLKRSLSCWLRAARASGNPSLRSYNNLLFCESGIKSAEFTALLQASSFNEALSRALDDTPSDEGDSRLDQPGRVRGAIEGNPSHPIQAAQDDQSMEVTKMPSFDEKPWDTSARRHLVLWRVILLLILPAQALM